MRQEIISAVSREMRHIGPDGFDKAGVVREFMGRGISRATLYRWVDAAMVTGKSSRPLVSRIKAGARARAMRDVIRDSGKNATDSREAAEGIMAEMPLVASVADIVASGGGAISVIEKLRALLEDTERVIAYAKTEDGKVRNPKLLLTALRESRQCLETAAKMQEAMMQVEHIERFHTAVYDVLRAESPSLVERVLNRMRQLSSKWGIPA